MNHPTIEQIASVPPPSWEAVFAAAKNEIKHASDMVLEKEKVEGPSFPNREDVFAAFHKTPLNKVKVVILGQDPYPQHDATGTRPRAVGLSFSVRKGDAIPSSLKNIFTELKNSVPGFAEPAHGDLSHWAEQGVLLLNTCLTVQPGFPGSHGVIWHGFIKHVFLALAAVNPKCIYVLWGKEAQKWAPKVGQKSIILEAAHPSGLSANRGFFGCNHFVLVNQHLLAQGKEGINWSELPKKNQEKSKFVSVNTKNLTLLIRQ